MDQDAFRKTYHEVNERFCAFEKSILINQCDCALAERFCIAEREGVHCKSDQGQARCLQALALLREHARFALHSDPSRPVLPHGQAMRIQVGGMRGIHHLLDQTDDDNVEDIDLLLNRAAERWGSLESLPFSDLMPAIAAYKSKMRSRRNRRDPDPE